MRKCMGGLKQLSGACTTTKMTRSPDELIFRLPVSRELPVDPHCDHRWDFPCCAWSPLPACRRQYPGRSDGIYSLIRFHQLRPSHEPGRVGSCIVGFGACSAFTHVTACTLAKSPSDSLHQRLQQSRCLHCCSDCYRVERTSSRAGLLPLWTTAFSRRTRYSDHTSTELGLLTT